MNDPKKPHLRIQTPCPKSWGELSGDDRKRFCSQCSLHVHNAAELTRREAEDLVQASDGRVCMRMVVDEQGQPQFRPEPLPTPKSPLQKLGLAFAAGGLIAACQPSRSTEGPQDPTPPSYEPVAVNQSEPDEEILGDAVVMGVVAPEHDPEAPPVFGPGILIADPQPSQGAEILGKVHAHPPAGADPNAEPPLEMLGEVIAPDTMEEPSSLPQDPDTSGLRPQQQVLLGRVALPPLPTQANPPADPPQSGDH